MCKLAGCASTIVVATFLTIFFIIVHIYLALALEDAVPILNGAYTTPDQQ